MKRSLFAKIFFSYLVIIILSFFVLNVFIRDEIKEFMTAKIERELLADTELINLNPTEKLSAQVQRIAEIADARVTLVDARGVVSADSEKDVTVMENHLNRPEIQEARLRGTGSSMRYSQTLGVEMIYVAVPIKAGGRITGYVRLARPLHDVQNVISKVYRSFFVSMIVVAALSLIIALIYSYRLSRPIKAMEQFTERLRLGDPVGTIILNTGDETSTLAGNINYLVEELRNKIKLANEEKSKLMTAFTSMNEGVLIVDGQGVVEFVSPVLSNMLAIQYEDVSGRTLMEAFLSVDLQKVFIEYKEKRENISREITMGDTDPVILNVSISAVQDHPDEEKTMIVFHDVTRLKKLEKIRVDFVANVTHEIRTPLTAIIGYLETIKDGAINNVDETKKFIEISLKQAQRLNRLVEDLLIISNIEMKETKLNLEDISLNASMNNVISLMEAKAKLKNITIQNNMRENMAPVKADRDRLAQIFVNVLDNAVKFTPEGGTVVISEDETGDHNVISVSDTGIGVPQDEIGRLGERFYRVDRSRSRELGGTGLGLSIVKHLMMAHGGKMEIESTFGRGTKVSLSFPCKKA